MFLSTQYHTLVENRNDATDFITEDFPSHKVLIRVNILQVTYIFAAACVELNWRVDISKPNLLPTNGSGKLCPVYNFESAVRFSQNLASTSLQHTSAPYLLIS